MTGSRLMHWILCCLVAAASVAGCTSDAASNETSGSLKLNLEVDGIDIEKVGWLIEGEGMSMSGIINTSAPGSTASVEVFGLLPGDYTVTLSATGTDEETMCEGSEDFEVEVAEVTELMVYLRCKLPRTLGGVRVNGKFNVCATIEKAVVSPLQTSVGNDIDLSVIGADTEGDPIKYVWSGTGGDIDDPNAQETTYRCGEVGDWEVTIMVTDELPYCMDKKTFAVRCVPGDGNACDGVDCDDDNECTDNDCNLVTGKCINDPVQDGTECEGGEGVCEGGDCVPADLCEGKDCSDGKECTDDLCDSETGNCSNPPVQDGTDCDGGAGMCVDGGCMAKDLCDGVTCEDTGKECTVGVCNMQTGNCDEMNVEDSTPCNGGAGACSNGDCIDNDKCDGVECPSDSDCVEDGTCDAADGSCIEGDPKLEGDSCSEGGGQFCDGAGSCVACNDDGDCGTDEICVLNECRGDPDIFCDEGLCADDDDLKAQCVEAFIACLEENLGSEEECIVVALVFCQECENDGECDDTNVCTNNECLLGECVFPPNDGAECEVEGGVPGLCSAIGVCEPIAGECDDAPNCTACNDGAGVCLDGVCEEGLAFTNTFALGGTFRAFNGLLPADAVCSIPDLEFPFVPGSSMPVPSDISTQCVNVPGVAGAFTFADQGGGNYNIDGSLDLDFIIDAIIPSPFAQVLIVTSSSTVYSTTGIGAVADGQYVRPQPPVTPGNPFDETLNVQAGTACNCEAIRDPDGNVAAFVPCGPTDPAAGAQRCDNDGELCIKRQSGQFFPGACVTGTTICSAAAKDFEGDACGCADGLCVSGGEACTSCGAGFACTVTSDCPAFASGSTCVSNVCTAPPGGVCDVLGGNPCSLSTDCPLAAEGQFCEFTGDPAIDTPGTCSAVFGPAAVSAGFCGNPGQTCTAAVCDPVGNPGGGSFCGQAFGQACLGGICQAVDLSDALCPLANLQGGLNYTPLPNDPLQRSWGSLLFTADNTTCGLGMVMDRDELGTGGPSVPGGWFVSNPPPLASDGTQFVGMTGSQQ